MRAFAHAQCLHTFCQTLLKWFNLKGSSIKRNCNHTKMREGSCPHCTIQVGALPTVLTALYVQSLVVAKILRDSSIWLRQRRPVWQLETVQATGARNVTKLSDSVNCMVAPAVLKITAVGSPQAARAVRPRCQMHFGPMNLFRRSRDHQNRRKRWHACIGNTRPCRCCTVGPCTNWGVVRHDFSPQSGTLCRAPGLWCCRKLLVQSLELVGELLNPGQQLHHLLLRSGVDALLAGNRNVSGEASQVIVDGITGPPPQSPELSQVQTSSEPLTCPGPPERVSPPAGGELVHRLRRLVVVILNVDELAESCKHFSHGLR